MSVGWIEDIYNHTEHTLAFKSVDKEHNGNLHGDGGDNRNLDGGFWFDLRSGEHYRADWCGIPWDDSASHYKAIAAWHSLMWTYLVFSQLEMDGSTWVLFEVIAGAELTNGGARRKVGRTQVSRSGNYHCALRLEPTGIFLDVLNGDGSNADVRHQTLDGLKGWLNVSESELAKQLSEALGPNDRR